MTRTDSPHLIAIVGGSGSGKTWLTERLLTIFGGVAARLAQDEFYRDRSHLPLRRRQQINYDHPRSLHWGDLKRCLKACRLGRGVPLSGYDFVTHTRSRARQRFHPKPLVLVEGLWLLLFPAVRQLFAFSIFIDCPSAVRLRQRMVRDVAERGRTQASVEEQFQRTVGPMHDRFVTPQMSWATVVLRPPLHDVEISRLATRLWGLLAGRVPYPAWMREPSQTQAQGYSTSNPPQIQ